MTLQTITLVADVPDEQTTAAEAAAAAFVKSLPDDAKGAVVVSATFGGTSLLPTPAERFQAARDALDALAGKSPRPTTDEIRAAVAELDDAARGYELLLTQPAVVAAPPVQPIQYSPPLTPAPVVDPAVAAQTAAQTVAAPTGEPEPAPAVVVPDAPAPTGEAG